MWRDRLQEEPRFEEAVRELWPRALGVLAVEQRGELATRVGLEEVDPVERGRHSPDFQGLWEEMTMVRRSVPGATW
jgi:hypothetical protein